MEWTLQDQANDGSRIFKNNTLHFYPLLKYNIGRSERYTQRATPKFDLPQGTLDLLILKAVALGPVHGYAIGQRLQEVSRDIVQVPQASLYPALHRLENRGLLTAQ